MPFDIETIATDTAAARFSERTQASLERLRSLSPRPYMYGSQLALEYFPRPNDLFRFGEFAIANTAAGLAEPGRVAAMRLRNLYPGVGLVADLADSGYAPVRDALSGSVHTRVLTEHMRGRVETTLSGDDELPITAAVGTLAIPTTGPASLQLSAGSAEVLLALPPDAQRRCYSLGFLMAAPAPVRIDASVVAEDGEESRPAALQLPASVALAGIVEVEPRPVHGSRLRLVVRSDAERLDIHDLFVISTG